jgi:hypothetical protein
VRLFCGGSLITVEYSFRVANFDGAEITSEALTGASQRFETKELKKRLIHDIQRSPYS